MGHATKLNGIWTEAGLQGDAAMPKLDRVMGVLETKEVDNAASIKDLTERLTLVEEDADELAKSLHFQFVSLVVLGFGFGILATLSVWQLLSLLP